MRTPTSSSSRPMTGSAASSRPWTSPTVPSTWAPRPSSPAGPDSPHSSTSSGSPRNCASPPDCAAASTSTGRWWTPRPAPSWAFPRGAPMSPASSPRRPPHASTTKPPPSRSPGPSVTTSTSAHWCGHATGRTPSPGSSHRCWVVSTRRPPTPSGCEPPSPHSPRSSTTWRPPGNRYGCPPPSHGC